MASMWKRRNHQRATHQSVPGSPSEERPAQHAHPEDAEFLPIPLHNLRMDTVTGFNLYLWKPTHQHHVLYREGNLSFTDEHRCNLEQSGITCLYISTSDRMTYLRYMEDHLDHIVADANLSCRDRSAVLYSCCAQLVDEIFQDPESTEGLARARTLVKSTVRHLRRDTEGLATLLTLTPEDYQLTTHATNTCVLGVAIGQRLGLCTEELRDLGTGILLHDIGKARIDARILEKSGPLTEEEDTLLKTHPDRGAEILAAHSGVSIGATAVVKQHHENCAGTGYPEKLRGRDIHQYARIAAIANTFDGLTSNRTSHRAFDSYPALRVMQDVMGDQFDPVLLQQLIRTLGHKVRRQAAEDRGKLGGKSIDRPAA
jgi:HD-GYP domain-containing protein (c-di-GMP phosphodiesterase class II)